MRCIVPTKAKSLCKAKFPCKTESSAISPSYPIFQKYGSIFVLFFVSPHAEVVGAAHGLGLTPAGDIEMGFVIHVELSSMTIDRLSNFAEQRVAFRWLHHLVVRLRA